MSIQQDRRQLEAKQKSQSDAARKAADLRTRESRKRADAAQAQQAAGRTSSASQARMKTSEATRALEAANKFGRDASALESKAASYGADAANLQAKISRAEAAERERLARQQALAQRAAEQERRKFAQQISFTQQRVSMTETALHHLKAPKVEKLRILMLGASSQGDLRVGREHTRIRRAVEVAVHRDQVEIDVRLSATAQDLLEGIAKFRPHVVHFSGHGDDQLIVFEDDIDDLHEGVIITASAFAAACAATDDPPTLVVLNACHSKGTAEALVNRCAPLAVGMNGSIDDADALQYATALYSSIANGHSVGSAHAAGKAAIELSGGEHDLPYLALTPGITASVVKLVQEP